MGRAFVFSTTAVTPLQKHEPQMTLFHDGDNIFFVSSFEVCGLESMSVSVFLYLWLPGFLYLFAGPCTTFSNSLIFLPDVFLLLCGYTYLRYVNTYVFSFIADTCVSLDFRLVVCPVTSNLWSVVEYLESTHHPSMWVAWFKNVSNAFTSFLYTKKAEVTAFFKWRE